MTMGVGVWEGPKTKDSIYEQPLCFCCSSPYMLNKTNTNGEDEVSILAISIALYFMVCHGITE